ncbi:hypothetical protein [Streptomyces sp. NPDC002666]
MDGYEGTATLEWVGKPVDVSEQFTLRFHDASVLLGSVVESGVEGWLISTTGETDTCVR